MGLAHKIQFYDPRTQELKYSQRHKIEKFLELGCIKKLNDVPEYDYACLPIPGYNKTTYFLGWNYRGNRTCTCQFASKNPVCSHIGAVREFIARNNGSGQGELF